MGLTAHSVGIKAVDSGLVIKKQTQEDKVVALAGNPNVGKSTVFNALTGMNQHTGNWPGKTVANAQGYCSTGKQSYVMVDIPGTYSLMAHSTEEEVARNFICFGGPDAVVVVCDATCLERNLNLVLQTIEISSRVVVCVNLMDEAKRKNIRLDLPLISKRLGVPVVGATARKKKTLDEMMNALDGVVSGEIKTSPLTVVYPEAVEEAVARLEPVVREKAEGKLNSRWLSLKLLDADESLIREIDAYLGEAFLKDEELVNELADRISGDDSFAGHGFLADHNRRQLPITASGRRPVLGSGQTDGTVRLSECARLAPRNTDPGSLPCPGMGRIGYAPAYGNLLSALYPA